MYTIKVLKLNLFFLKAKYYLINLIFHLIRFIKNKKMILNFLTTFLCGFMFNFLLFVIALLGLFGKKIRKLTKKIVKNQPLSFYIISFLSVFMFFININSQIIYCEDVTVITNINDVEVTISGGVLNNLFRSLGTTSVYIASMRIASALLSKYHMSALPRIGAVTLASTGLTFGYTFAMNPV
jgi:hypothetical protein